MTADFDLLSEPQKCFSGRGKKFTDRGLASQMRAMASSLEGDMSQTYSQMDEYEKFWRIDGGWDMDLSERQLREWFPRWQTPEGRNLADSLLRAVTKKPVEFKVVTGSSWTQAEREAAARMEQFAYGCRAMVDAERRIAGLRPLQWTLAWQLIVRGMAVVMPLLLSSPRQKGGDKDGYDRPFMWRTPDPRETSFTVDGDGVAAFAHHYWRDAVSLRRAGYTSIEPNPEKRDEGLCDTVNLWWKDQRNHVWNATVVEDVFTVEPVDHTEKRGLTYLPVFVDAAYGAPPETMMSTGGDVASRRWQYQGAMENNLPAYRLTNRVMAYQMILLRDAALWGLVTFSNKNLTQQDMKNMYTGKSLIQLDPNDKPPVVLQPPQISESVERLNADLAIQKAQGGLPEAAAGNIPPGVSGVLASIMAQRGDIKAGPISDALKRMLLGAMECTVEQFRRMGRSVKLSGYDGNGKPFMESFKRDALPESVATMLDVEHEPVLVKDEYAEAQTWATLRNAGMPLYNFLDSVARDPEEAIRRRFEEMAQQDPMVINLEMAKVFKGLGREDLAKAFMQRAQMLIAQEMGPPAGNAPVQGVDPEAAPMPAMGGGRTDPSQQTDQQRLGQLGLEYGGR